MYPYPKMIGTKNKIKYLKGLRLKFTIIKLEIMYHLVIFMKMHSLYHYYQFQIIVHNYNKTVTYFQYYHKYGYDTLQFYQISG